MPLHSIPCSWSKNRHASPNHHRPTTMLHSVMHMLSSNAFSIFNPTPWPTIRVKPIYHCLVTQNHMFPIINGPSLIPLSKPHACKNMFTIHNDFPCCTCVPNPTSLKTRLTMMLDDNLFVSDQSCFVVAKAFPNWPSVSRVTQHLFSWYVRSFGHSSLFLNLAPYILPQMRCIRLAHAH